MRYMPLATTAVIAIIAISFACTKIVAVRRMDHMSQQCKDAVTAMCLTMIAYAIFGFVLIAAMVLRR